jgi:hypothetical protein
MAETKNARDLIFGNLTIFSNKTTVHWSNGTRTHILNMTVSIPESGINATGNTFFNSYPKASQESTEAYTNRSEPGVGPCTEYLYDGVYYLQAPGNIDYPLTNDAPNFYYRYDLPYSPCRHGCVQGETMRHVHLSILNVTNMKREEEDSWTRVAALFEAEGAVCIIAAAGLAFTPCIGFAVVLTILGIFLEVMAFICEQKKVEAVRFIEDNVENQYQGDGYVRIRGETVEMSPIYRPYGQTSTLYVYSSEVSYKLGEWIPIVTSVEHLNSAGINFWCKMEMT